MKRSTFLWLLYGLCFLVAVIQNVLIDGQSVADVGMIGQSVGSGLFYWVLSALPVAFQRNGVKWWPSVLILVILVAFGTLGRLPG